MLEYKPITSETLGALTTHMNSLARDGYKMHLGSYTILIQPNGIDMLYTCVMYREPEYEHLPKRRRR